METCDCCKKEKPTTQGRALGPRLHYKICDECAKQMQQPGSLANLWLEEMRRVSKAGQ